MFSKYAQVIPLKDKRGIAITNVSQNILDESNHKPKNLWVDRIKEFYNRSIKLFLHNNNMEMYSMHDKGNLLLLKNLLEF